MASAKEVRAAAMGLLARREHSQKELRTKLASRFDDADLIKAELVGLSNDGLQSDQRFAEMFVRSRVSNQCGPLRITRELQARGVSASLVSRSIDECSVDWGVLIQELSEKKYGRLPPENDNAIARRIRFFQYKGFSQDHIRHVISTSRATPEAI